MSSDFDRADANNIAGQGNEAAESPAANWLDRRHFLVGAAAGTVAMALPRWARASESGFNTNLGAAMFQDDLAPIRAEITKRHDETVQRLQTWIRQPSIAAENRGMNEGCDLTMRMLRDAGFQQVTKSPHRRPARNLRHAGRGRAQNSWSLLHV